MTFIVVGLDGSSTSRKAFHEAIRQATWRNAKVLALHVVHYPYGVGYPDLSVDWDFMDTAGEALLSREIADLEELYDGSFPVQVDARLATGHCGVEMMKAAKGADGEDGAALIVLGSRGYGSMRGLLLGSVTTYAVHHLTCPVLVVPADEDEASASG